MNISEIVGKASINEQNSRTVDVAATIMAEQASISASVDIVGLKGYGIDLTPRKVESPEIIALRRSYEERIQAKDAEIQVERELRVKAEAWSEELIEMLPEIEEPCG